jgi:hypothetical protein
MRRNFSRGKNSARLVPGQISSDPREMFPQNSQLPDLATVQDRCKKLWDEIIAKIVAIRDEFDKYCPEKSFAKENPSTKNMPSWRNRTTFLKRVANLMSSAQRGLQRPFRIGKACVGIIDRQSPCAYARVRGHASCRGQPPCSTAFLLRYTKCKNKLG